MGREGRALGYALSMDETTSTTLASLRTELTALKARATHALSTLEALDARGGARTPQVQDTELEMVRISKAASALQREATIPGTAELTPGLLELFDMLADADRCVIRMGARR